MDDVRIGASSDVIGMRRPALSSTYSAFALTSLPLITPGDDLAALIFAAAEKENIGLKSGDIVVIAQKVVSKAEDAFIDLKSVTPSIEAKKLAKELDKDERIVEIILRQSQAIIRKRPGLLVVEDMRGFIMANAGVDASNVGDDGDRLLTLPDDPDCSAERLQCSLESLSRARLGVVINDSWGRPFRLGTVGFAVGIAGIPALIDSVGTPDLFGRTLLSTVIAVADEIAAAGSLLMGGGGEGRPVVILRGLGLTQADGKARDLLRDGKDDMFR